MIASPSSSTALWLWSAVTAISRCEALLPVHRRAPRTTLLSSFSPPAKNGVDSMREDIESLRQEAERRLAALTFELEEFQHDECPSPTTLSSSSTTKASYLGTESDSVLTSSESLEGDLTTVALADALAPEETAQDPATIPAMPAPSHMLPQHATNLKLLDNTRWKIVFNLGREPGTWMPPTWGASGDRLRFTVVVDLLDRPYYEQEDFLEGLAGTKQLRVLEAWIGPTFSDANNHGKRNLQVSPTGGYKVVRGAGPMGTDVLRFFIEAEDSFRSSTKSDVLCPKGRVYGNCGYFPTLSPEIRDTYHAYKDRLQKDYRETASKSEALLREKEEDTRLISWDAVTRIKDEMKLRSRLDELDHAIQEARQRDPERGQLRKSREGNVGLTKDGGVCCKVQKGVALEYHILGRMEIAAVEKEHGEIHEDYEDLVRKANH